LDDYLGKNEEAYLVPFGELFDVGHYCFVLSRLVGLFHVVVEDQQRTVEVIDGIADERDDESALKVGVLRVSSTKN
jgi:hypothetical protein